MILKESSCFRLLPFLKNAIGSSIACGQFRKDCLREERGRKSRFRHLQVRCNFIKEQGFTLHRLQHIRHELQKYIIIGYQQRHRSFEVLGYEVIKLLFCAYLFRVLVLVQRRKLDKRTVGISPVPPVEPYDQSMHIKQKVVIRLLQGLCNRIKFTLIAARIVRLRLSRHRTRKV